MCSALQESKASPCPVIASNIPRCQELFEDGKTNNAAEVKNTQSLITAIEKFIQLSYSEKVIFGMNGKMENEFGRDKVVRTYIKEINYNEYR